MIHTNNKKEFEVHDPYQLIWKKNLKKSERWIQRSKKAKAAPTQPRQATATTTTVGTPLKPTEMFRSKHQVFVHVPLSSNHQVKDLFSSLKKLSKLSSKIYMYILNTSILWWHEKFFVLFFEINFTRYRDCVPMLSLMLFLDCSSDHWKYEKLLLCYCGPMVKTAVLERHFYFFYKYFFNVTLCDGGELRFAFMFSVDCCCCCC